MTDDPRRERSHLLRRQSDAAHDRCVITLVGPDEAAAQAAFSGIATAARLIDLTQHQGAHPRFGAADVARSCPCERGTCPRAWSWPGGLAALAGSELDIAAYLCEDAAVREDHRNVADVRRGEVVELLR